MALLGLDRDENLFLDAERWTSRHIPLVQQRGPFSLGGDGTPAIHVDLDDPRVDAEDGSALFLPHGGNGRYLDHVTRVLGLIRSGAQTADAMYAALDALGLLQALDLDIVLDEERRYTIPNYLGITREGLAQLRTRELELLHADGYLGPAFLLAASLANITALIDRKLAREAA